MAGIGTTVGDPRVGVVWAMAKPDIRASKEHKRVIFNLDPVVFTVFGFLTPSAHTSV